MRSRNLLFTLITIVTLSFTLASCGKKDEKPEGGSPESKVDSALGNSSAAPAPSTAAPEAANAKMEGLSDKAKAGENIFLSASFGKVKSSCAMCHTNGSMKDSRIRSGHTLAGVTKRTATWNGMFKGADLKKNAYGASLCATLFQEKPGGLKPEEADALNEYFAALEKTPGAMTKNLTIQWPAQPPLKKDETIDDKIADPFVKAILKLPGDPKSGEGLFARTCAQCHSFKEKTVGPKLNQDIAGEPAMVANTLRFGSSAMVFFAKDVLTDQQVADLCAFVQQSVGK
jgi:mono/diheme cytochrome c family protein